jgi:hypothetical protein
MGVCKEGYISVHSVLEGNLDNWSIEHTQRGPVHFWFLSFVLSPGHEGAAEFAEIGRIKDVQSSIRMTREKYIPSFSTINHQQDMVALRTAR